MVDEAAVGGRKARFESGEGVGGSDFAEREWFCRWGLANNSLLHRPVEKGRQRSWGAFLHLG